MAESINVLATGEVSDARGWLMARAGDPSYLLFHFDFVVEQLVALPAERREAIIDTVPTNGPADDQVMTAHAFAVAADPAYVAR